MSVSVFSVICGRKLYTFAMLRMVLSRVSRSCRAWVRRKGIKSLTFELTVGHHLSVYDLSIPYLTRLLCYLVPGDAQEDV